MKKRFGWYGLLLGVVCGVMAGALVVLLLVPNPVKSMVFGSSAYGKMTEIEYLVNSYYYKEADLDAVADSLALGYMFGLDDAYADYYDKEEYQSISYENEGGSSGIGILVNQDVDTGALYVYRVVDDSPAQKAGLKDGDLIVQVGDTAVTMDNYNTSVEALAGKSGSKVKLVIRRGKTEKTVTVTRGEFVSQTVFARSIGDYYYIEITSFNEATVEQFEKALGQAQKSKAKGLILDVRGNGGGLVNAASDMLDQLLPEGDLLYAKYRDHEEVYAVSDENQTDLPMVVLVNGDTASSGEYFASAIRDYKKGVLIGNQTYGKGIMQSTYELSDGSAVKLTVATIMTKSRTEYHGVGLKPDQTVKYTEEQGKRWYRLGDKDPYIQSAVSYLQKHK